MSATVAKGLATFKAQKAKDQQEAEERNRPKANYFNWKHNRNKEDKNTVYGRFLQEFDDSVDTYREDRGLPIRVVEHTAPGKQGYLRRATCTAEDGGECYPCERHPEDRKLGWGQKKNFYTWFLVDYQDGEGPQPVVISRSFGSAFVDDLIEFVEEDENNRITDKMFKITRSGAGKETKWKLREAKGVELYDDTDVEVLPLEQAVLRDIPYSEQAEYYGQVWKDGDPRDDDDDAPAEEPVKASSGSMKW
jgi:hypothetical protein